LMKHVGHQWGRKIAISVPSLRRSSKRWLSQWNSLYSNIIRLFRYK